MIYSFSSDSPEVCINDQCFNVKIADDASERVKGLMYVEKMNENEGMIFIFDSQGEYSFWMKNTLIPLDIIWINENKSIVYVSSNNQPCGETCEPINPQKEALYVLEINSGLSEKHGFLEGDNVEFKNIKI